MSSPPTHLPTLPELFTSATSGLPFIRIADSLPRSTFASSQLKFLLAHTRLTRWAQFVTLHDDALFAIPEPLKCRLKHLLRLLEHLISLTRDISLLEKKPGAAYFEPEDLPGVPRLVYERLSLVKSARVGAWREEMVARRKWCVGSKAELDELHRKIALVSDRLEETVPLAPREMGEYDEDDGGTEQMVQRSKMRLRAVASKEISEVLASAESGEDPHVRLERLNVARVVRDEAQGVDPYLYVVAYNVAQTSKPTSWYSLAERVAGTREDEDHVVRG